MKKKVFFLELRTWVGYDYNASHYYGELHYRENSEFKRIRLEFKMTKSDAENYNKNEKYKVYEEGYLSERFPTKEKIISTAIEKVKQLEKELGKSILVLGRSVFVEPQPIVYGGKTKAIKRINELYEESEKVGGYEGDEGKMEKIHKEWYKIFKKNFIYY